uniref:mRNA interferase n=1 Tax=Candidatus Kentrum sp. UNK TaxID=2126344 RepID=A0A451A9T0_9GAMM|nr:MAG: transcriptional modulator of MazE/toxin, MazF [Candidatus Kentron sp. UNK]VFK70637.1 MAG: transcriptional modulator of MazE/toxin, MazF [Candidatus Kentron sp. UNK]
MTGQEIRRGDIWWINLDPTQGSEIRKTRPCVVLTHDTLNNLRRTVVVVPLSTAARPYPPITVPVTCQTGSVVAVVDQIRAVAKSRFQSRIERLSSDELDRIRQAVSTILEL